MIAPIDNFTGWAFGELLRHLNWQNQPGFGVPVSSGTARSPLGGFSFGQLCEAVNWKNCPELRVELGAVSAEADPGAEFQLESIMGQFAWD